MADRVHRYQGKAVRVTYDKSRCVHAGDCARTLPGVFNPREVPWVYPDGASVDEVLNTVCGCPTGALKAEPMDGRPGEVTPDSNTITITADGPLFARGRLEITTADGTAFCDTRIALCRCGASQRKPLCDGSHKAAGFAAGAGIPNPQIQPPTAQEVASPAVLQIRPAPSGPLILNGPLTLRAQDDSAVCSGVKTALCRCGASENKPFCDGSHARIGFVAS